MFADLIREDVEVTHQGQTYTVTIQKLSAKSLGTARLNRSIEMSRQMKEMGGDIFKAMQEIQEDKEGTADSKRRAHYAAYDTDTILQQGIHSWTIPGVEKSAKNIERLDLNTAKTLKEKIIDLSDPYKEPEEIKAEESKD